jgi:hypothetical protein
MLTCRRMNKQEVKRKKNGWDPCGSFLLEAENKHLLSASWNTKG